MSFDDLHVVLSQIAQDVNAGQPIPEPNELAATFPQLVQLAAAPDLERHLVQLDEHVFIPKAVEALRLLTNLKRRWNAQHLGQPLVARYRFDPVKRIRPVQDQEVSGFKGLIKEVASYSVFPTFSKYQTDGWKEVDQVLKAKGGMVITAPTGAGKTEVFMLPLIRHLAEARAAGQNEQYILLYPRVALLKDQLSRALLYAHQANLKGKTLPVGMQFFGIGETDEKTLTGEGERVFDAERYFLPVRNCPVCRDGDSKLKLVSEVSPTIKGRLQHLQCDQCKAKFPVTISRQGHATEKTPLLIMTAESLDQFYLRPNLEGYLQNLTGVVVDEAHLFESLYGVHIYNVLRRVEEACGHQLTKIASSATIGDPEAFVGKLFYGSPTAPVTYHRFDPDLYAHVTDGIECFITLQSVSGVRTTSPLLIQAAMLLGHGILAEDELQVAFIDSIDGSTRFAHQITDAEVKSSGASGLWDWRTIQSQVQFGDEVCPRTNPANCSIYSAGECWRGLQGGHQCWHEIPQLRERPLRVSTINSRTDSDLGDLDAAVATPTLEVGVDDRRIKAVIQYGAPRSIAGLTQRRGRAGRGGKDIAYSLMLLGNSGSDNFALFRRQRILDGNFNIPLNPANPVMRELHELIRVQREVLGGSIRHYRHQPRGTVLWMLDLFLQCPTLTARYEATLNDLRDAYLAGAFNVLTAQKQLREWVKSGIKVSLPVLEMRRHLQVLSDDFPEQLREQVAAARQAVTAALEGDGEYDAVETQLRRLHLAVSEALFDAPPQVQQLYGVLPDKIRQLATVIRENQTQGQIAEHERLYSFFYELNEWLKVNNNRCFALMLPPKDLKAVVRALYYLHINLEPGHACENCASAFKYLVPETYFSSVQPIKFELRYSTPSQRPKYEEEPISSLANLFYPYRLSYRYYNGNVLTGLATEHREEWVQQNHVNLDLPMIGIELIHGIQPQQVPLRAFSTDESGLQLVKLCRGCYRVHSLNKGKCCEGHKLDAVKIFAAPWVEGGFYPSDEGERASNQFCLASGRATTTVMGSEVSATRYRQDAVEGWLPMNNVEPITFTAQYRRPIRFGIRGRGTKWTLTEALLNLIENPHLENQFNAEHPLTADRLRLTAAALYKRVIANVAGVHHDTLQSAVMNDGQVWVWEIFEGGAGITEVFAETLREDSKKAYLEFVRTVACPINLAETAFFDSKTPEQLLTDLAAKFKLAENDPTLTGIIEDVKSELERIQRQDRRGERVERTCSENDGCPVCLHDEYLSSDPARRPSRRLAEALTEQFVQVTDQATYASLMTRATRLAVPGAMPRLLRQEGNDYYVLVL